MNADKAIEQFAELRRKTLAAKHQERAILREQEEARKLEAANLDVKRQTGRLAKAEASLARAMEAVTSPAPVATVPTRPAQPAKNDEKGASSPTNDEKEV